MQNFRRDIICGFEWTRPLIGCPRYLQKFRMTSLFGGLVFCKHHQFYSKKDAEMRIGCYRGSRRWLICFILGFQKNFERPKEGIPPKMCAFFRCSLLLILNWVYRLLAYLEHQKLRKKKIRNFSLKTREIKKKNKKKIDSNDENLRKLKAHQK